MVGWVSLTSALSVGILLARVGVGLIGVEGLVEGFDGAAVQAGPDVGVHVGGDVQPGMTKQVFDRHEFDALFQQQRRTRMLGCRALSGQCF
jgi:hypothetical protein